MTEQNAKRRRARGPFPSLAAYFAQTGRKQADLAADLEISEAHMSNLVSRRRYPSRALALKLAQETHVPLELLIDETT